MIRTAVRRTAALSVAVLSLLLLAVPAFAAEEAVEHSAEAGALDTSGLVWAFGAGILVALWGFFDAYAGAKDEPHGDGGHHH
ncbi:MAG: hypothetical protein ACLGIR_10855 [Actinomycetes bacterium]